MENVIEVRYAGVLVGRSTQVRDWSEAGAFVGFAEPLPSGTALVLKGEGVEQAARVVHVIESADPVVAGMQVTFVGAVEAVRPAPKPKSPAPDPMPPPSAAPVEAAPVAVVGAAPVAVVEAAPIAFVEAGPIAVVEAAPVEISDGTSSAAVSGEVSGPTSGEHGEGGQPGQGGGKRRRRRR